MWKCELACGVACVLELFDGLTQECLARLCITCAGSMDISRLGDLLDDVWPSQWRGCVVVVVDSTTVCKCGSVRSHVALLVCWNFSMG